MDLFFDILKITIPSVLLLIAVGYIVGGFLRNSEKLQQMKLIRKNQQITVPLRLQAYERLILFLERISPDSILLRANYPDKTSQQLHQELLQSIRAEFEHNLSQQLYVSIESWNSVKNARNYTIALINSAAAELEEGVPAIELSRNILAATAEMEQTPTQKAIDELKRDIQQIF
ncbi:MAG: hypothetical protein LBN37_03015 [Bacteroidales bacterium]|jgi:hypothetical protein|nr:hypothetical protein [Bacteroidales bacterium]